MKAASHFVERLLVMRYRFFVRSARSEAQSQDP